MITLIACVDKNMGIGKDNKLLVHLPKDLEHFKNTTEGHMVLFGKNTWDSLPVKPLPNRQNIVMTRNIGFRMPTVWRFDTIDDVLWYGKYSKTENQVFICGGEAIYKLLMPYADELIISHMDAEFEADTFFPRIEEDEWMLYSCEGVEDNVYFEIAKYYRRHKGE